MTVCIVCSVYTVGNAMKQSHNAIINIFQAKFSRIVSRRNYDPIDFSIHIFLMLAMSI